MVVNPYEAPREPGLPPRRKPYRWNLFVWDAVNVCIWLVIVGVLAALFLPAVA
jgi:hypothetical protein